MILMLTAVYAGLLAWYLVWAMGQPRRALLAGLVLTVFATEALPVRLVPVDGMAMGALAAFAGLVVMWWLGRARDEDAPEEAPPFDPYALLLAGFWLLMVAALLGVDAREYGLEKCLWFGLKVLLPLFCLRLLAPFDAADLRLMFHSLVVGGVLVALGLATFGVPIALGQDYDGLVNPISIARITGQGAFLALAVVLFGAWRRPLQALACLPIGVALGVATAFNGERGPLLAGAFALAAFFVVAARGWRERLGAALITAGTTAAVAAATAAGAWEDQRGIQRIVDNLANLGGNTSDLGRIDRLSVAWQGFLDTQGMGVGTGGFPELFGVVIKDYPHNVVLEVAVEQGVLGLTAFGALMALAAWRLARLAPHLEADVPARAVCCVWFYALVNAMVSGDLVGNGTLFLVGGVVWLTRPDGWVEADLKEDLDENRVYQPG